MYELKIKIKIILPLWGIGLGICTAILMASTIWDNRDVSPMTIAQAEQIVEPEVLGESIDLRGQPAPLANIPTLNQPIDDSAITSDSYLVADAVSGQIIASKNSTKKAYIASLTKLLTALVAYQKADLNAEVTLTDKDIFKVKPVLGLKAGDNVKLLDIFNAMLVGSSNDAALALANHVENLTDQNFIGLMNEQAKILEMDSSHFSNPLGFDSPANYSTAEDLLKLVLATQKFSSFTELGKRTGYNFTGSLNYPYHAPATDKLVTKYPEISAIKTGFTQGAGQAMITKATKDDHSIIIIILSSKDRGGDTLKLEKQIFDGLSWNKNKTENSLSEVTK